jgi:hypothetical protein
MASNMREQRDVKKIQPVQHVDVDILEISVAKNRSLEPFIKTLIARPENIMQEPLGTLVGLFSVSDHGDNSAYVVNFLASTAKKEYFLNPRRGAIESFESALHHMNLALAELVKNGQTKWVGSLHGIIAIIENGNIHFSVTGDGNLLLFRNDQLVDISLGLAPDGSDAHPLKTFIEISSGRVADGDSLILTSPEIFDVFTLSELERNARRLVPEGKFARFLDTALTNELRIGGAVILEAHEKIVETVRPAPKRRHKEAERIDVNAWSATTFEEQPRQRKEEYFSDAAERNLPPESEKPSNDRFGAIYVQGETTETPERHPMITSITWTIEDIRNFLRRGAGTARRKAALGLVETMSSIATLVRHSFLSMRQALKRMDRRRVLRETPEQRTKRNPIRIIPEIGGKIPFRLPSFEKFSLPVSFRRPQWKRPSILPFLRYFSRHTRNIHLGAFFGRLLVFTKKYASSVSAVSARKIAKAKRKFFALPQKRQLLIATGFAFSLTLLCIIVWNHDQKEPLATLPEPIPAPTAPTFPPSGEKNSSLATPAKSISADGTVTSAYLKNRLFLITKTDITDAENGKLFRFPFPSPIVAATAMDDLSAIFLVSEDARVTTFYPTTGKFTTNTITLPNDTAPRNIGTFLTYLYVLDPAGRQIVRFPRAEGGFGDGKNWITGAVTLPDINGFAVSENIYLHSATDVAAYTKGKPAPDFSLERPDTPLSITALCANPDAPDTFVALDAAAKRLIVYSSQGKIMRQLFDEQLAAGTSCSLNTDGTKTAVSSDSTTLVFANQ